MGRVLVWLFRLNLVFCAAAVMWWEGSHQREPGIGFAFALGMLLVAALIGTKPVIEIPSDPSDPST